MTPNPLSDAEKRELALFIDSDTFSKVMTFLQQIAFDEFCSVDTVANFRLNDLHTRAQVYAELRETLRRMASSMPKTGE